MDPTRLGDQVVFTPIDAVRFSEQLDLTARGTRNGKANSPPTVSKQLDDVEAQIVQEVGAIRTRVLQDVQLRMESISKQISESRARIGTRFLENTVSPIVARLEQDIATDAIDLDDTREKLEQQREYFSEWRLRRRLKRPATEPRSGFSFFADLFIIALAEGGLNLFFFMENNPLGITGAFLQALLIAGANILACTVIGFVFFKRVNSVFILNKMLGFFTILLFIVGLPFVHFIVGFYRMLRGEASAIEGSSELWTAVTWAVNFEFNRLDELSIILILVGVVAGAYAARKGYEFGDKYPDYTKTYWSYQGRRLDYLEHLDEIYAKIQEDHSEASNEVNRFLGGLGSSVQSIQEFLSRKTELSVRLKSYESHLLSVVRQLLATYRSANQSSRSTPIPKHFDTEFLFADPIFDGDKPLNGQLAGQLGRDIGLENEVERAAVDARKAAITYEGRIKSIMDKASGMLNSSAALREELPK